MSISLADRSTAGDAVLTSDEVEQVPTMLCETDIGIDEPARMLPPLKSASKETTLLVPVNRRARSRSPDTLSILSAEDFSEIRFAQSHTFAEEHHLPTEHAPEELQKTCSGKVRASWMRNKGLVYVLLAQAFGSLMNVTTRILERGVSGDGWHPIQVREMLTAEFTYNAAYICAVTDTLHTHVYHVCAVHALHVVAQDTGVSIGSKRRSMVTGCPWYWWFLRCIWTVLFPSILAII